MRANFKLVSRMAALGVVLILTGGLALAQEPTPAGPSFDAQSLERKIGRSDSPGRSGATPLRSPRLSGDAASADTKPFMTLSAIDLQGASALPAARLMAHAEALIGRRVSQADLAALTEAMTREYREAGYFLSRVVVPPQDIKGGRLVLRVVEGAIAEIRVEGARPRFNVAALLAPLTAERPARLASVERKLMTLNDTPGLRVRDTVIDEPVPMSGAFVLTVIVESWDIHLSSGVDNTGSDAVGPWQAYSALALNSVALPGDSASLLVSTAPHQPDQLAFGRLAYDAPVGPDSLRFGGSLSFSDVYPNDSRRALHTRITTVTQELHASYAVFNSAKSGLTLGASFAATDSRSVNDFGPVYEDKVRAAGVSLDYRLVDSYGGTTTASAGVKQGLDVFGASTPGAPLLSRRAASGQFNAFTLGLARLQSLNDVWSVRVAGNGQLAAQPVLLSQQFLLGGAAYGPGYYSGDNGVAGLVELRFDQEVGHSVLKGYQLYTFMDGGAVWNNDGGPVQSLYSAGIGARLYLAGATQLGLALAVPVRMSAPAPGDTRTLRVLFSLTHALKLCPNGAGLSCS